MELDFEPMTLIVTVGMWAFILFLTWGVKFGFSGIKEKIVLTIAALPIIYFIVLWQKNRWYKMIKKIFKYIISLARPILITSNLIVFTTFIATGFIMYKFIGNKGIGLVLFFAAFLYIIFNKLESIDRRLKLLEEK